ncbi:MAG: UDP-N-acetylmuramoylalanyl-D-glutamyl-2, 6-diaminopimelate--D-alanyl-D-alanine ligase, partial [Alphaproteobacteria bacterium]|nr:UDP-N-acetylmuramoylalanyl-D-glutamyl-2, 6-diaminopimelate--D-alanyl-D-alanine ligase [Alphaproteobacteria bacterium]
AEIDGVAVRYALGAPGRHCALNSLAVLATVSALGADVEKAAAALADLRPLPGRGAREIIPVSTGDITLIDESYNAKPSSMRAALTVLGAAKTNGRRIAILGDMLELGPDSAALHARLSDTVEKNNIDLIFTIGADMTHLYEALPKSLAAGHAMASEDAASDIAASLTAGDVVMVKGSLGSRMSVIVDAIRATTTKING